MKKVAFILSLGILLFIFSIMNAVPVLATVEGADPSNPDLVYIEIRATLDEAEVVGNGVPLASEVGLFRGYILPIWSDPVNLHEELYFDICVPNRWDGENDIIVHLDVALTDAGENGNAYKLELAWNEVTPNLEAIPVDANTDYATRYVLSNTQYFCYRDSFLIDYDIDAANPILRGDNLALRLRRQTIGGQYTDLDGDLLILHCGILFPRGDLLGDPESVITEDDMELLATELENFNALVTIGLGMFLLLLGYALVIALIVVAFWKWAPWIFGLAAGASLTLAFAVYDTFDNLLGLSQSIILVGCAIVCISLVFRTIFWGAEE